MHELFVGSRLANRGERERGHDDRQTDPRATPEELLHQDRQRETRRVHGQGRVETGLVEALSGRLLEDGPRQLLRAIVLRCRRANDLASEALGLFAQLLLLLGQLEREAHNAASWKSSSAAFIVARAFQAAGKPA